MQIVIDMTEDFYKLLIDKDFDKIRNINLEYITLVQKIKNGTLLPKGHGKTTITGMDLISRKDLLNAIWQKEYGKDYDGVNMLNIPHIDIIEQMPSAEKTTEWKYNYGFWFCTKCGYSLNDSHYVGNYCPNCPSCGEKMKGVEE